MNAINTHFATQYGLPLTEYDDDINVDLFAGGGGASTGVEMGLERPVHIAINHNPNAISMHKVNHPGCLHFETDVWDVDPVKVLAGRRIGWFHASPDCTHHSQAAGGQPRKKEIRDLSWVVLKWAGIARPRVISLENVKQIRQWGPLVAKRCKQTGRVVTLETVKCPDTGRSIHRIAEPGERVPRDNQYLVPDKKRAGRTWKRFIGQLQALGYAVEYELLRASDFGAGTTRQRLFMVARCDDEPIVWPAPTHAKKPTKQQQREREAADSIDWSIPCPSIFLTKSEGKELGVKRPLADATLRRIAKGIKREVIDRAQPFIVPIANWSSDSVQPVDQPLNTITSWPKGGSFALATAFLAQANGGYNTIHSKPVTEPVTTITNTGSQQQLVTAFLSRQFGTGISSSIDEPAPTVMASGGGGKSALVELKLSPEDEAGALRCAAFLMRYYASGGQWGDLREPLHTLTTKDRIALVTVWVSGSPYVIVDIGLRMLQPHELYSAQGFPSNYIIDRGHDGRIFTKAQQVHMCGNSVSPPPMAAIARANNPYRIKQRQSAAA